MEGVRISEGPLWEVPLYCSHILTISIDFIIQIWCHLSVTVTPLIYPLFSHSLYSGPSLIRIALIRNLANLNTEGMWVQR